MFHELTPSDSDLVFWFRDEGRTFDIRLAAGTAEADRAESVAAAG